MAEPRPVLSLTEFLPYQMSIATNAVSNLIANVYEQRFGLRIPEWRLMAVLGQGKPRTQRELADMTRMDKVTVNRAAKTLVDRRLVDREPSQRDGRSHHLRLSDEGRALYEEIVPIALSMEQRVLSALSAEERTTLAHLLDRVRETAEG